LDNCKLKTVTVQTEDVTLAGVSCTTFKVARSKKLGRLWWRFRRFEKEVGARVCLEVVWSEEEHGGGCGELGKT
jgi:hypothetical protein